MRARTRLLAGAAVTSLALLASACGGGGGTSNTGGTASNAGTPVKGGVLNMLGVGDVDYMDPQSAYYSGSYMIHRLWSRQLYTYPAEADKTTTSVPDLADGPVQTSADGLTVTVKLRDGAQWNTNPVRPVVAGDEVIGVKRTCNPVQPFGGIPDFQELIVGYADYCAGFAKVKGTAAAIKDYVEKTDLPGVTAPDDKTIVFKLTHPASYFQDMLTLTALGPAPKEFLDAVPGAEFGNDVKNLISDGPYYIDEYTPTKTIDLKRNPAWNESSDPVRKAYVDQIKVTETGTQESIQQQLETGTDSADMAFDTFPPATVVPGLLARKDKNLNIGPESSSNPFLIYNTVSPNNNKAMANVAFRQALSTSINRANLIQVLGGPTLNSTLTNVLPANIVGGEQPFDPYPFDAAKGKTMLSSAGGDGATIKILYRNASQGSTKVFQTVQQQLTEQGLKVEGVPAPNADFYTKYLQQGSVAKRGVWDIAIAGWGSDWYGNAALSFFGPLYSGEPSFPPIGSNYGFYNNPKTNELIKQATNAKTQDEAAGLWRQADQSVMADAAFYPITNPNTANYKATQVNNAVFMPSFQNFDPANVWLSQGKQGG
ncbi:ABC transporter substrate-binding protein [Microlunatus flavus]|uniref:Peptide/nickel transport system substrate-binding protein n=1 Tax=Microlunatus flavus TaxID=1036181 RepID=A0A1H9KCJ5_9ACTN|nr:ABC transporter substrate-binding protein [Microlunatus flavus]SEQ96768.1 peptide/nickel transport system substrate-binding protein [Microlunatus flavus]